MTVVDRLQQLTAADWWDKLSPAEQQAYFKAHPSSKIKLEPFKNSGDTFYIHLAKERIGMVIINEKNFLTAVHLRENMRGKGLSKYVYNAVEHKLKRPLLPSPLNLSDSATRVWQKRLARLPPEHAKQLLNESFHIGKSYDITKHVIDRLQPLLKDWQPPIKKVKFK
jgi:hypothetical protein